MISLLCKNCGMHWYTANSRYVPKCDACGGDLIEDKEDPRMQNRVSLKNKDIQEKNNNENNK